MNPHSLLEEALNQLLHLSCWAVMVNDEFASGLTLYLGDQLARSIPLDVPDLPTSLQLYSGAFELVIADCTWRLDSQDAILTSWSDPAILQAEALAQIEGINVQYWEITWPGLDLTLHFENALALRLFCDQTDEMDAGDNYALLSPSHLFHVGTRSHLTVAPRPKI
ncbi:MAG: hypothetical protein ACOYLB_07775 [Phototrophicaceae bacterium]